MHAADVKSALKVYSLEIPAREKDDLKEEPIVIKLRKVSIVNLRTRILIISGPGWRRQLRRRMNWGFICIGSMCTFNVH